VLATAVLFAAGAAACGSSSKPAASSNPTTSIASGTSSPPTTSSTPTTQAKIDCSGTSAYVTDIGVPGAFKPVTPDTLTVVTSLPGPGFWVGSDNDPAKVTSGYEYDIAKAMQQAFGLSKLVVRNENFDSITAGSVTNYDVALSQVTINCKRAKVVKFTIPYFASNQGILVNKGTTVPDLATAKKIQWAVQSSTTAADLLATIKPDHDPKVFQSLSDAYAALQAKQVDAVLIDITINLGEAQQSKGKFEVVGQFDIPSGPDNYGGILPKGSTNGPAVNAVLKSLADSGQLASFAAHSLGGDPGSVPVIKVP
jgi:polar amino acid transport system substrate-binding protein